MSFPPATEMFQFAGFASRSYIFTPRYRRSGGLPHSEILGSKRTGSSPRLNAACHVLHRLSMPRHPPNALQTLDHTQPHAGSKGQISEVRFQMSESRQLKQPPITPNVPRMKFVRSTMIKQTTKFRRGLVTGTSTGCSLQEHRRNEHAIVRRLVSKEDKPRHRSTARAFFTSSSQYQRT